MMQDINNKINKFSIDRDWDQFHSPKNLVMALTGEVGELNEIFQWLTEKDSLNLSEEVHSHAKEEVADIAIYLLRLCTKLNINIEDAILSKLEKNEKKYPVEQFKGSSQKSHL